MSKNNKRDYTLEKIPVFTKCQQCGSYWERKEILKGAPSIVKKKAADVVIKGCKKC